MAYAVELLVTFSSSRSEEVREVAARVASALADLEEHGMKGDVAQLYWPSWTVNTARVANLVGHAWLARWYLEHLSQGLGFHVSNDGAIGQWVWGTVGNHTSVRSFVELLRPFWIEVLGNADAHARPLGGMSQALSSSVVVLYEGYRDWWANAVEIRAAVGNGRSSASAVPAGLSGLVVTRRDRLPFTLANADERPRYANLPLDKARNCYGQLRMPEGLESLARRLWEAHWKSGWEASANYDSWDGAGHFIIGGDGIDLVTDPLSRSEHLVEATLGGDAPEALARLSDMLAEAGAPHALELVARDGTSRTRAEFGWIA